MKTQKRIVITAYDVNPYRGSESGTGWNFPFHIADANHHVTLITRPNNRPHIEKFMSDCSLELKRNMSFAYFDLPYWARFWKKKARGARVYFRLWQYFVVGFIRKEKIDADIYHGLNFHSDTTPSFLWLLRKKSVWGPINHNEAIPEDFLPSSWERFSERSKWFVRLFIWNVDPTLRLARSKTDIIIAANQSVVKRLRLSGRQNYSVLNTIASKPLESAPCKEVDFRRFRFLCVGRFVPIKSMRFAIEAFEIFYTSLPDERKEHVELLLVGSGPQEKELRGLVTALSSRRHIFFKSWVPQHELYDVYRQSNCFVNFSHEGAGAVNAEAMAAGLPIICFHNFGPGEMIDEATGHRIPITSYTNAKTVAAERMRDLFDEPDVTQKMGQKARDLFEREYSWNAKAVKIKELYSRL